ncbi:hypothetical protein Tsp_11015 [Trichinella spiralis]|uniref:hypothetical protein n=1 Tax=Trichinella spiralis TaxID=6334 RepID=UPI0001EFB7B1|nr:hypothetical protein Tsp_11015 [Trichinella spiralis]
MADISELRFVPNRGGSTSLVSQGRTNTNRDTPINRKNIGFAQKYALNGKEGCKGVIWTNRDVTCVITQNDHIKSCPVDEHLAYKMEKKAVLKKRSAEETKSILAIYDEVPAASAVPSTSGHFPLFKRVKSTMYRHQAKRYPKLPSHRRYLQIPVPFRTTKAGDDFLLWRSASRQILVFATGSNIRLMATRRTWALYDTFKVVPQWYQKPFTIHAFLVGKLVTAVNCLCTDKDIPTYEFILSKSGITSSPQRQS